MEATDRIYVRAVLKKNKIGSSDEFQHPFLALRITINRTAHYISLGKRIEEKDWDAKKSEVKKTNSNSQAHNRLIRNEISKIETLIANFLSDGVTVTITEIKNAYRGKKLDFIEFCEKELTVRTGSMSVRKLKEDKYMLGKIIRYSPKLAIDDITREWLKNYEHYLRNTLGNGDNTVSGNLKFIRTYFNEAKKQGKTKKTFPEYKIKFSEGDRDSLELDEVQSLFELWQSGSLKQENDDSLHEVLRCYLWSVFACGMRFTDVKKLKWDRIQDNKLIFRPSKKRKAPLFVPLIDKALRLLPEKKPESNFVFTTFENRATNRKLAKIMEMADIDKKITFHTARHTFAMVSLDLGMALEAIQDFLDHADMKTTKIYAKMRDKKKITEIQKWESV